MFPDAPLPAHLSVCAGPSAGGDSANSILNCSVFFFKLRSHRGIPKRALDETKRMFYPSMDARFELFLFVNECVEGVVVDFTRFNRHLLRSTWRGFWSNFTCFSTSGSCDRGCLNRLTMPVIVVSPEGSSTTLALSCSRWAALWSQKPSVDQRETSSKPSKVSPPPAIPAARWRSGRPSPRRSTGCTRACRP
jgi:hypothetical protein